MCFPRTSHKGWHHASHHSIPQDNCSSHFPWVKQGSASPCAHNSPLRTHSRSRSFSETSQDADANWPRGSQHFSEWKKSNVPPPSATLKGSVRGWGACHDPPEHRSPPGVWQGPVQQPLDQLCSIPVEPWQRVKGGESPECHFAGGSLVSPGQQPKEQMDGLFQGQPCSIRLC